MFRRLLTLSASALLLAACTTTRPGSAPESRELVEANTPYGMFLAGQAALNDGRSSEAARFFDLARADPGAESLVAERAFTAALLSGDVVKAAAIAPKGEEASEAGRRLGVVVLAVEALAQGQGRQALQMLHSDEIAFPHRGAAALLAPWAAAQAGDVEASLVKPELRGDRLVEYFGVIGRAALMERARRYDEAEAGFKLVADGEQPSELSVLAYGAFLERRGRKSEAVALYDKALAQDAGSLALARARTRALGGKAPPPPTLREGAAQALLGPAATMVAAKQGQLALAYLRLALRLDPGRDDAWIMIGDLLQAAGDTDGARVAYGRPKAASPHYAAAQAKLAWSYQQAEDSETALRLARAAAASGDADARITFADLLRANERHAEALEVMNGVIGQAKSPDWRLYFARAAAAEKLGRWSEAEADLQAALKIQPEEPELLNYLGYSWIDRGVRLQEALAMVEKAVSQNPRSGAMVDSLGWAHYRLGDYKLAVQKLEQAVELEAGDPEINDHLGDAYWRVGRRDEAKFQWRRVLTLNPDAKLKARVEAKLASGLGPDGPEPKLAGQ
jgi:tetratricopeptide (TPR) repeat protein